MKRLFVASLLAFTPLTWALDQAGTQHLGELQQRWAQIQYQTPKDQRADAFEKLAGDAASFVQQYPGKAEPLIWDGIINSSWAGATGGLGALSKVKDEELEQVLSLDPRPAYQEDADRVYKLRFAAVDAAFKVEADEVHITGLTVCTK